MVQVDIFWSYGLASGLALGASQQLQKCQNPWMNKYFISIMGWIVFFFTPSGVYLLWEFPAWETMFVARDHESIPSWLAFLFVVTNLTQGLLGYYVTYRLLKAQRFLAAKMQTVWSHACMFFILFVGWDGTGFKRLTYSGTAEQFALGYEIPWQNFFSSPVFYTLLVMGFILASTYIYLLSHWKRELGRGD